MNLFEFIFTKTWVKCWHKAQEFNDGNPRIFLILDVLHIKF